ncbi:aminotransferase [Amylibacter kogurei]|uniref:Aminotransferase n=1 Tax=Paramylibacter kogurei TaxID=1889778 RepID=A0A2G5K818_9RHOB|nr:aspartate aminotransferase family protein [Amylibacter kogurei]PIB25678.1 aminotransferase [Amylibacter kogurei]
MTIRPNSIEARDTAFHLHGYTNPAAHLEIGPLVIERGDGVHVFDNQGNKYIEAMAGLWSAALGFSETRLVDAATKQMKALPYYHSFAHRGHTPAAELADTLVNMAPGNMSKAFFTNSGSEAIDTAIKLIWYRSNALGKPEKKKILVRNRAYHGVTVAAAALTGLPANHASFDQIVPTLRLTCPHYWREGLDGETEEQFTNRLAEELENMIVAEGPETIAAFFGEPVLGAGGVVTPPKGYWAAVQKILKKYDILLVADEVICGFGRTGQMFGCNTYDITPDMMTLSKQLSSSYMPSSALLMNERVFEPLMNEANKIGTLGHGYTGSGHPVACAVANETIRIIREDNLVEHAAAMGEHLRAGLNNLSDHPLVGEVRGVGLIAAVELVTNKETKTALEKPGKLGLQTNALAIENGFFSRPMMDAMAFCPPLIIQTHEIDDLLGRFEKTLDQSLAQLQKDGHQIG